jgi:hexosaminidase
VNNVIRIYTISDSCLPLSPKLHPKLTERLTGDMGGYYSQDDARAIVAYARDRGIRVIPEVSVGWLGRASDMSDVRNRM